MNKYILLLAFAAISSVTSACDKNNPIGKGGKSGDSFVRQEWTGAQIAQTWEYVHQDTCTTGPAFYTKEDILYITTRANTADRPKLFAPQIYLDGKYTWKTYIPEVGEGDRTSVGSWIYCDDHHEIDFECGWGTDETRRKAGAGVGDLVACMTNQDFPFSSSYIRITPGWHEFGITLDIVNGFYYIHWLIDGTEYKSLQTSFGPEQAAFRIFVSVENLNFIGMHPATQDNTGAFEWVKFKGHTTE